MVTSTLQDAENIQPDKLLTDRSSYISYLESQLERLTNACLTVQSFDDRIQANAAAARALEEKASGKQSFPAFKRHAVCGLTLSSAVPRKTTHMDLQPRPTLRGPSTVQTQHELGCAYLLRCSTRSS